MIQQCTRCEGSGFLNLDQVDEDTLKRFNETGDPTIIEDWIDGRDALCKRLQGCTCHISPPCSYCVEAVHDVAMCDCCSNGDEWYFLPGLHDSSNHDDPRGCR